LETNVIGTLTQELRSRDSKIQELIDKVNAGVASHCH
jgi:hypothetical protein